MVFRHEGTNWAGIPFRSVGGIVALGDQIESLRPGTHKHDGTVASKPHDDADFRRNGRYDSDHSAFTDNGKIRAIDIGHNNFAQLEAWAEAIRRSKDDRVKYFILGSMMFSSYSKGYIEAWVWRPYSGPYHSHLHGSLVSNGREESTRPWQLEDEVAQFTDDEATALKAMVANMRDENSTPAYVTETIKLIRKERGLPLHAPESADVDALTLRVEGLEQFEQEVRSL